MSNFNFLENLKDKKDIEIEEIEIKKLIEDIYKVEEKINYLNNIKNKKEPKLKKISELGEIKNNLNINIKECNKNISLEIKKNDIFLEHKKMLINELDQKINEDISKLNSFNIYNFNSLKLIKFIFTNKTNNRFLSKEQIEDILNNQKNNISVDEELTKIIKEKEINKASKKVIENSLINIKKKKEQIEENLYMLEEEKNSSNDELIDLISLKESIDCIIKIIIGKLIENKNGLKEKDNDNIIKEEEINKPIEILIDELMNINPENISLKICDDLFDIYDLDKKDNDYNFINKNNIYDNNKSKNRSGSYEFNAINNKNFIEDKKINNGHIKSGSKNIKNKIINNNINDEPIHININTIKIKKSDNNSDKKILCKLIQNEIKTFLSTQYIEYNKKSIDNNLINDFLFNLSMIIINKMKNIFDKNEKKNIFISSNDLMIYLSYFFKMNYYEILIGNHFKFIEKDYKLLKKEIKKNISEISNELIKLEEKLEEIKIKEKINLNMIEIIQNKSKENNCYNSDLYENEKNSLELCSNLNDLLNEKEKIKKEIEQNNNDLIKKKEINEIKINELTNKINNINNEIKLINNDIENITVKNNEDIINYREIIADKFNQIKTHLKTYRNKKQNNLNEYNQFVEKMNDSIKQNFNLNKSSLFHFKNLFNEDINNNIFINGNEIIINDIEKNSFEKKILKKHKKLYNSLIGIGINDSNTNNNTSKRMNRSMTGINIHNSSINNIYNIYNNVDNSLNFNNNSNFINFKNKEMMNKTSNNIYSNNNDKQNISLLNKSKNLKDNQINLDINFTKKNHKIYNISSLPNENKNNIDINNLNNIKGLNTNKNKSALNIRAKIKEIKKINNKITNIKSKNIPNINKIFFQSKKSPYQIINNNSSRVVIDQQLQLNKYKKEKKANSHEKGKSPILPLTSKNIYFQKLNPLNKITFCYYREILLKNNQNITKYNPLKETNFNYLNEFPYNFMKCSINLSNNYDYINLIIYNDLNSKNNEIKKLKIEDIENTVVSSNIKKIIEIYRNYNKCKDMNNFVFEDFINKEHELYPDMNNEDIKRSTINQNYNFSLITKLGKRLEFIIGSYEEFKMWINGLAFIIKNKNEFIKKNKDY